MSVKRKSKRRRQVEVVFSVFLIIAIVLAILIVPRYVTAAVKSYQKTMKLQEAALKEDHWVYSEKGRRYVYADGTSPRNKWLAVDQVNYHFNSDGYMDTGWLQDKGTRYYLKPDGTIQTGWLNDQNSWYYFNGDGTMASGWILDQDTYYFLKDDGTMATGWIEDNGKHYYLSENGAMATGWLELNGNNYYFDDSGAMATGWITVDDKTYFLRDDGVMTIGWITEGDQKYFMNADGSKAVSTWIESEGKRYYFDENGSLKPSGWLETNNTWYYIQEDGSAATGWLQLGKQWYYLKNDGSMATGWITDENGKAYFMKDNGVWDPNAKKETPSAGGGPMVALTFDDGPGKYTDGILTVLQQNNAKATFFMLGKLIPKYPETVKRMKALGCELGNHSYDHSDLSKMDAAGVSSQINTTNQALVDLVGEGASCVRPPYGAFNPTVRSAAGAPLILWSIDTLDCKTRDTQTTIDTVLNNVKDGDIVLMHDIHEPSAKAAETLIPALREMGYQLVTVSELAAAKGIPLENGKAYGEFH